MSDNKFKPNWKTVKFGDVVRHVKDRVKDVENCDLTEYTRGEHFEPGNLHLIGRSQLGDGLHGSAFHMRFRPGDVLYVSRNPQLRKVAVADYEGICANTSYVFRANEEYLLQELLPFIMQTEDFVEYTIQHKRGSTNFYLNPSDIEPYEFPLPPIDEQRRIAELLWAADDVIVKKQELLENLKVLRQSVINDIVPDPDNEPELSFQLEDVCEMQNGKGFPSKEYTDHGIKLLRPGNLGINGYFDWNSKATTHLPIIFQEQASDYLIESGDVVINLTAQSLEDGFMGRVCLARDGDESLLNQRIGRFKCKPKIKLEYLYRCFQTIRFRQIANSRCEGTKVKHMYWRHIADFKLVVPDIKKQDEVIEKCAASDSAIFAAETNLEKTIQLKKQLLNSNLTG